MISFPHMIYKIITGDCHNRYGLWYGWIGSKAMDIMIRSFRKQGVKASTIFTDGAMLIFDETEYAKDQYMSQGTNTLARKRWMAVWNSRTNKREA